MLQNFSAKNEKKKCCFIEFGGNFPKNVQFLDQNQLAFLTKINLLRSLACLPRMP